MFLWKNAIVICFLLGLASFGASRMIQQRWEKGYVVRLAICGGLITCFSLSFLPWLATQFVYAVLVLSCFDKRVPMVGTYFFFFFWTPAAGSLLGIAGAYIAPLTPFMAFTAALVVGYLLHPENHLRRPMVNSDIYMMGFVLIFCVCASLRAPPTGIARNVVTYVIPYILTYQILSRVKIGRPEMVLRLLMFGAAAASTLCIFESIRHWPLYAGTNWVKNDVWTIDAPSIWLERGGALRAYGPYAHPLTGGAMLGLAAIAGWGLYLSRGRSGPVIAVGLSVLIGLAATLSRSGMVAVAVGLMVFQLLRGRYLLAVLVPIGGLFSVLALPILAQDDARFSAIYRLELLTGVPRALGNGVWFGYREAIQQGKLDAFIQGQGIVDLVNTYLGIVVQGGVASVIPFIVFLLSAFPHYRAIRRMKPARDHLLLAQTMLSMQAGLMVALGLMGSWTAPMQIGFIATAILVALRFELAAARARPRREATVMTLPVDEGERLPALR